MGLESILMKLSKKNLLYLAFGIALFSTLGSLYFSEVLHFPPCILCWYQRIAMFPLAVILFVGILKKDKLLPLYVLPLSFFGLVVSFYQNFLYFNVLPQVSSPCTVGVSCSAKFIQILGFLDIPQLSFIAFLLITAIMLSYRKAK